MRVIPGIAVLAVVLATAACGGKETVLPERVLTSAERDVCDELPGVMQTLVPMLRAYENDPRGLRSASFRGDAKSMADAATALGSEPDSPLSKHARKFLSAYRHASAEFLDLDDMQKMVLALVDADNVCVRMDPVAYRGTEEDVANGDNYYTDGGDYADEDELPEGVRRRFLGVSCPGGPTDVDAYDYQARTRTGSDRILEFTVSKGDATGDNASELIGSFSCAKKNASGGGVHSVVVMSGGDQLGQTMKGENAFAKDGRLRLTAREKGKDTAVSYRLDGKRWKRLPSAAS